MRRNRRLHHDGAVGQRRSRPRNRRRSTTGTRAGGAPCRSLSTRRGWCLRTTCTTRLARTPWCTRRLTGWNGRGLRGCRRLLRRGGTNGQRERRAKSHSNARAAKPIGHGCPPRAGPVYPRSAAALADCHLIGPRWIYGDVRRGSKLTEGLSRRLRRPVHRRSGTCRFPRGLPARLRCSPTE